MALTATQLTLDHMRELYNPARDDLSLNSRVERWTEVEGLYHQRKEDHRPYHHEIIFLSGEPGCGKTLVAGVAGAYYRVRGMECYSTTSLGYGLRVDAINAFRFATDLTENAYAFFDEVHVLSDVYTSGASRQEELAHSLAMIRKLGLRLTTASTLEERVGWELRSRVKWLYYPETYVPPRYTFPPWAYIRAEVYGPFPWKGKRLNEKIKMQRRRGKYKGPTPGKYKYFAPRAVYEGAKLIHSWEQVDRRAAKLTAAQMRKLDEAASDKGPSDAELINSVYTAIVVSGWDIPAHPVHWRHVHRVVSDFGGPQDPDVTRRALQATTGLNGAGNIRKGALREFIDGNVRRRP